MLKTIKSFALLSALVLLAACGATGPKYAEHEQKLGPIPQDHGRIYIYRNSYLGAAVQPEVKLNGEVIEKAWKIGTNASKGSACRRSAATSISATSVTGTRSNPRASRRDHPGGGRRASGPAARPAC